MNLIVGRSDGDLTPSLGDHQASVSVRPFSWERNAPTSGFQLPGIKPGCQCSGSQGGRGLRNPHHFICKLSLNPNFHLLDSLLLVAFASTNWKLFWFSFFNYFLCPIGMEKLVGGGSKCSLYRFSNYCLNPQPCLQRGTRTPSS